MPELQAIAAQLEQENKTFLENYTDISPDKAVSGEEFLAHLKKQGLEPLSLLHHAKELIELNITPCLIGSEPSNNINNIVIQGEHSASIIDKFLHATDESVTDAFVHIEGGNFTFTFW